MLTTELYTRKESTTMSAVCIFESEVRLPSILCSMGNYTYVQYNQNHISYWGFSRLRPRLLTTS